VIRWSGTIVRSLSRDIPGGDAIDEFIQVVQFSMDDANAD
jgi:hypothetical protein